MLETKKNKKKRIKMIKSVVFQVSPDVHLSEERIVVRYVGKDGDESVVFFFVSELTKTEKVAYENILNLIKKKTEKQYA